MKYYLVAAIDTMELGKVEILRQYNNRDIAITMMKDVAMDLVRKNGGERQVDLADIDDISPTRVARASCSVYPTGYYVKQNEDTVDIYEKYIETGWWNSHIIHKIKVINIIEIELDDNMKLQCDEGTLYKSVYHPTTKLCFMQELKRVLMKRKILLDNKEREKNKKNNMVDSIDDIIISEDMYISDNE